MPWCIPYYMVVCALPIVKVYLPMYLHIMTPTSSHYWCDLALSYIASLICSHTETLGTFVWELPVVQVPYITIGPLSSTTTPSTHSRVVFFCFCFFACHVCSALRKICWPSADRFLQNSCFFHICMSFACGASACL